jgi:D-beta-D-heptose 7-phosphate kinase/D-beta-D-heptose 1-phosphate adenosyltransferase
MNIQPQKSFKVLLIGDSCVDEYVYGTCDRLSPEAPVPVHLYKESKKFIGMAHNVYLNLLSFGIDCDFHTNNPEELIKRRFVDLKSMTQIMRQDVGTRVETKPVNSFLGYDAIVISDYDKGLIDPESIKEICETFTGPIFVDSKREDLGIFPNAIIKINQYEADQAKILDSNKLIVTHGKSGATYEGKRFEAPHVDVYDVTGAGDIFLASLCYFYLTTGDFYKSIPKCVSLSTKSVQHLGSYILTEEDINEVRY